MMIGRTTIMAMVSTRMRIMMAVLLMSQFMMTTMTPMMKKKNDNL